MSVILESEVLGMDYHQYMRQPNWYIRYMLGKKIVDAELQSKAVKKPRTQS